MQDLINFFEKETNKKIHIYKYNNQTLQDNQTLVSFENSNYIIEYVNENSYCKFNGYAYLFYQFDLDFLSLQDILYNLYEHIQVIKYDKYLMLLSSIKLDIDNSTPDIIETETYRNAYIVYLDKINNKDSLDFKIKLVNELLHIMIKDNSIDKYIDLHDLIIYKTIDLVNKDMDLSILSNLENLNNIDENLLTTGLNFIENGLNISKTSNSLYLHRNTLIYRLDKIKELLNLDLKIFKDALIFYINARSYFYIKSNNI